MSTGKRFIGPQLQARRGEMTQVELSKKTGLAQGYISRLEQNRQQAGSRALHKILTVFGISEAEFMATKLSPETAVAPVNGEVDAERLKRLPDWAQELVAGQRADIANLHRRIGHLTAIPTFEAGETTHGSALVGNVLIPAQDAVRFWLADKQYVEVRHQLGHIMIFTSGSKLTISPHGANMISVEALG